MANIDELSVKILVKAVSRGWYYFVVEDIGYDWKYLYSKKIYVCKRAEGAIVFKTAEIYKNRVEALLEIAHRRWKRERQNPKRSSVLYGEIFQSKEGG